MFHGKQVRNKMKAIRKAVQNMKAYIPGEKAAGDGYIILNANENPYETSPDVNKASYNFV